MPEATYIPLEGSSRERYYFWHSLTGLEKSLIFLSITLSIFVVGVTIALVNKDNTPPPTIAPPTIAPTTASPTIAPPTTIIPTTESPTSVPDTTATPTTAAPTTTETPITTDNSTISSDTETPIPEEVPATMTAETTVIGDKPSRKASEVLPVLPTAPPS